ncbi:DUF6565 domain-containing protein [Flavobacterium ovatum]|uniref:DUF6565 domain-containing protein n=1 Tax=Flavobacterium ovatum TaxID=1928857 RepID=UPI0034507CEE
MLFILSLSSCQSFKKDNFLNSFESFVNDVELNSKNYNKKEWADSDKEYYAYVEIKYPEFRETMTDAEINTTNVLIGKYQALKIKSEILNIKQGLNDILDQASSFANEIVSDTTSNNK